MDTIIIENRVFNMKLVFNKTINLLMQKNLV